MLANVDFPNLKPNFRLNFSNLFGVTNMAISISITRSNSLLKDDAGYAHGIIKDIRALDESENEEYELRNVLEFLIEAKGALEPINLSFRTGSKLNAEPKEYAPVSVAGKKGRKVKEAVYNNFTKVCLNCKVISLEELEKISSFDNEKMQAINDRLTALVGKPVKWGMTTKEARDKRTGKPKTIPVIDIQTVEIESDLD